MTSDKAALTILIGLCLAWPGSCYSLAEKERRTAEEIARRAIERNFGVTPDRARQIIQQQREWEGR